MIRIRAQHRELMVAALLGLAVLAVAILLRGLAFDDPFVTYRYAENLAAGHGFVYNQGERVLSTTAPLYAILLAAGSVLGAEIPSLSNIIGILSLWAGGWLIYRIGRRFGQETAGAVGGLLYATFPLLWLSLGFEVPFYLLLVLGAFYLYFENHLVVAAVFLGCATLVRPDGAVPAAILLAWAALERRKIPWKAATAYALTMLPLLGLLTWWFGSPLPATLSAKSAQTILGVTGFYPGTRFLQGALILAKAWFGQSPLYVLLGVAGLSGLALAVKRERWALPFVAWALAYGVGYHLLKVAPYHWYYAAFVPAGTILAGLAVAWVAATVRGGAQVGLAVGLAVVLLVPQAASLRAMERALHSGQTVSPDTPGYKALPEIKTEVYRRVGEWLAENAPPDADVGVTEVGVMGYYSRRRMVDFLGLLRPGVMQALGRGDVAWALFRYQPDYLALTEVNPLYNYDVRRDPWFRAAYEPAQQFADPRFWAGPVTVYRRTSPRYEFEQASELPASAAPVDVRFGNGVRLLGYKLSNSVLRPGEPVHLTLYWTATEPVAGQPVTFVHLLGENDLVAAQRDGVPCMGGCPVAQWVPGQVVADDVLLGLPPTAYAPDTAQLEIGLYSPDTGIRLPVVDAEGRSLGDSVRLGSIEIGPNPGQLPNAQNINFGGEVTFVGYDVEPRSASAGETIRVTTYWSGLTKLPEDYTVFARLLAEDGTPLGAQQSPLGQSALTVNGLALRVESGLPVPAGIAPGAASLEIGLYRAGTEDRLTVLDADGHLYGDRLVLSKVRIWP